MRTARSRSCSAASPRRLPCVRARPPRRPARRRRRRPRGRGGAPGGGGGGGGRGGPGRTSRSRHAGLDVQPAVGRRLGQGRQHLHRRRHAATRTASRSSTRTATSSSSGARPAPSQGQFSGPKALAVDAQGNVYVADAGNKRIQIFDGDGNFKSQFAFVGTPLTMCMTTGADAVPVHARTPAIRTAWRTRRSTS